MDICQVDFSLSNMFTVLKTAILLHGCQYNYWFPCRNMQMMLSSLLHHTGYNEQLYKPSLVGGGLYGMSGGRTCGLEMPSRSAMPSISRLQQHVEWAWGQGFDLQGSDQLGGKLFNTRKWIGATEVVTVLSSLRIRLVFFKNDFKFILCRFSACCVCIQKIFQTVGGCCEKYKERNCSIIYY